MDESKVQDLTLYPTLDENVIMRILQARFAGKNIYTYIKNILLAVNPFQSLDLYDMETMNLYRNDFAKESPHVFAIAQAAYTELMASARNQVILINGESGAGKTETFKFLVTYLAKAQKKGLLGQSVIEDQIIQINPILEAFGNAHTTLNHNSSRFGKFTELWFDDNGTICGAKFIDYLLEKSRITKLASGERNYHIFYYLFAGLTTEEKAKYHYLESPKDYVYLSRIDSTLPSDKVAFEQLKAAFAHVGFGKDLQDRIYFLLSAILRLGNVTFRQAESDVVGLELVEVENPQDLQVVATLLGISNQLLVQCLTTKTVSSGNRQSSFASPLSLDQAKNIRDTLAKALYEKLFKFVLAKLNVLANNGHIYPIGGYIGLLDIYGFEVFERNDFEQFSINFANEKLQAFFNDYIFKFEQSDYSEEGIRWSNIDYVDNLECLNLFTLKPTGLIALLDEECNFPGATAASLVTKFSSHHAKSANGVYSPVKVSPTSFVISHFAAKVTYQTEDFIEKNRNNLNSDVLTIFGSCESPFVQEIFASEFPDFRLSGNMERPRSSTRNSKAAFRKKKLFGQNSVVVPPKAKGTIINQFKISLEDLIRALVDTNPYFIRCIKSNPEQKPLHFEEEYVRTQLKYLGVVETVRIRKMGYSVRLRFEEFSFRYQKLKPRQSSPMSSQDECLTILSSCQLDTKAYQIGKSKVFLRESGAVYLEKCLRCVQAWAVYQIMAAYREYQAAKKHEEMVRLQLEEEERALAEERLRQQQLALQREEEARQQEEARKGLEAQKEEEARRAATIQQDLLERAQLDSPAIESRGSFSDIIDTYANSESPTVAVPEERTSIDSDKSGDSEKKKPRKTKEETKKMFEELIKNHSEMSTTKGTRGEKFNELVKSEQKKLVSSPEADSQKAPEPPKGALILPALSRPTDGKESKVATLGRTKSEEVFDDKDKEKSRIMGKLFKSSSKNELAKEEKKKEASFDDFLKSDKTMKMTLRDGNAMKKETANKFETYAKSAQVNKDEPPKSKPVMERLYENLAANKSEGDIGTGKRTKRRSQTISDLRSLNALQDNTNKASKILIWIEQLLGESLLSDDLIQVLRNGEIFCRLVSAINPGIKNPYAGKGDTFTMQKITHFLQFCRQVGVRDRDTFSVVDLEAGQLPNVVKTFYALSERLSATGFKGPLLENHRAQAPVVELADEGQDVGSCNAPQAANVLNEIIETEKSYIQSLKIVISYLDTIRRKQLLNKNDIQKLFSNIEEILSVQLILLKELTAGKSSVGAVFLKMTHYLKVYSVYCANYPTAVSFLQSRKEHDHLRTFLNTFLSVEESKGLPIETFLMKPVQRICKYPLLLNQVNAATPQDHPSKASLVTAIGKIEQVVDSVNERMRQVENSEKLMQIEQKFVGDKLNLLTPTRKFIHEGEVFKVFAEGKLREREIFLFNDLFILATPHGNKKEKFVMKTFVSLDNVELVTTPIATPEGLGEDPKQKIGIEKFNENHKKGIEYLIQEDIIDQSPESIAAFLLQTTALSKSAIGECIGAPANKAVLKAFCDQLDISGMRYDEALRSFLFTFRLPGEAQIIDRIVQSFAVRYCDQNPGIFPNADLAYTLVFAMIMLNTSLYNPKVDRKMSLEDFVYNFRNADEDSVLSDKLLEAMYKSIKEEKLEMGMDEQDQSGRIPISVKNFPNRLVFGEKSAVITVSIPMPDPSLKLKLQGQGLVCEPNILTFETSAKQTFTITGSALGNIPLAFAKMGKSARLYSKPHPGSILVRLPALEYNFQLNVTTGHAGKRTQETLLLGVKTPEEQKKWLTTFEAALNSRKDKSRTRSDSSPAGFFLSD